MEKIKSYQLNETGREPRMDKRVRVKRLTEPVTVNPPWIKVNEKWLSSLWLANVQTAER